MESPYLTRAEAAAFARCTTRTIQRWQAQGLLNKCGVGRALVDRAELTRLLAERATEPKE